MKQILEKLKTGNSTIVDFFVLANEKWKDILSDIENVNVDVLAKELSDARWDFERICNNNTVLGKAIMPWSGFAHLYSCQVGFEDNGPLALKLSKAFQKSSCSLEVKFAAERAAKLYSVEDYA